MTHPQIVDGQRVAGLRFDDPRVGNLMQALCLFVLLPEGFRKANLRQIMAQAMGVPPQQYHAGRITCDLRRLRLHGLIERLPHTTRYRLTPTGTRVALFFSRLQSRVLRPGLSQLFDACPNAPHRVIAQAMNLLDQTFELLFEQAFVTPRQT